MTTCAAGHPSQSTDFCDECGLRIGAPPVPARPPGPDPVAAGEPCVVCAEPLAGTFCENCGHDRTRPRPAAGSPAAGPGPHRWTVTLHADRAWFDEVCRTGRADAGSLAFPAGGAERRVELTGPVLAIGRSSGGHAPEIDVAAATGDLAVSARHGELRSRPDGSWEVVDLDSTNGTRLERAPSSGEPGPPQRSGVIPPHVPVALAHGDRIRLGAWTTITVRDRFDAGSSAP